MKQKINFFAQNDTQAKNVVHFRVGIIVEKRKKTKYLTQCGIN